jgi:ribose/xylose/arabinose/galactoside ABC-type transport system permease subunit
VFRMGNDFEVLLVVIIAGVSIYSREGSIIRVFFGTVFVVIVKNLLSMHFVSDSYQILIIGCLFLIFSTIYQFSNTKITYV